ncbi:MAG TPA: septal ring lytic transglycosylase RlpA family protein [Gammaproteobacteria bacterium]
MRSLAAIFVATTFLAGCASTGGDGAPEKAFDASGIPDAVPKVEPYSRYGNPDSYVVFGERYHVLDSADDFRQRGDASWYGTKFHGRRTSSGETYDMYLMTAAHKTLPLPTYVRVTNLDNDKSIIVRVNDRGPFHDGRIIDLSYAAALKLDVVSTGTAPVEIVAIDPVAFHANDAPPEPALVTAAPAEETAGASVFIQLGAFSSADNALDLKRTLEVAGLRPVTITPQAGDSLFRVRLGPFTATTAADEAALKLISLGITEFDIIAE